MDKHKFSQVLLLPALLFVVCAILPAAVIADDSWSKVAEFQTKMAKKGSVSAQFILGEMYQEGRGVKQNYQTSLEWFKKAQSNGHKQAAQRIAQVEKLIANPPPKPKKAIAAKPKPKPKAKPKARPKPKLVPKPKSTSVAKKPVTKKPLPTVAKPVKPAPKPVSKPAPKQAAKKPRKPAKTTLMDAVGGFDDEEDAVVVSLDEPDTEGGNKTASPQAKKPTKQKTKKSFLDVEDAFE